jgi:ribosomal-protein-serine acetyltransferase
MFSHKIDERTELRPLERQHARELFERLEANRAHLRRWHPQVELLRTLADVEKSIAFWQQQTANNRGIYAGIWHDGRLCGMINHLSVDWQNRCAVLSYWLDAAHQGRGIMTACCRVFLAHAFDTWKLNRVTIESATENARSRAIAERLGFKLEGIVRGIEWLHDHFADHALYGLLRSEYVKSRAADNPATSEPEENLAATVSAVA